MVQLTTTHDATVFTYMASTLALSSFPILGSIQQCGQLLRGECQDSSTLGVLPCLRALPQGLQGEGPIMGASLPLCHQGAAPSPASVIEPPGEERGTALAVSILQGLAYNPWPEKQERPAGSDTRTAVFRLVPPFLLHLPPSSIPGQPRPVSTT